MPRTVAAIHMHAAARPYSHGSYGQAGRIAHVAHDWYGSYGSCPLGVEGVRGGRGVWGAGEVAPGSYGLNIQPEKIAPIVVLLYII